MNNILRQLMPIAGVIAWLHAFPAAVQAQTNPPATSLAGSLLELQAKGNQLVGLAPDSPVGSDVTLLASLAALEATTAPYGNSTGGFTFTFDRQLGVLVRSARTFGPTFSDRSLTTGRGKLSIAANWLHSTYDSLVGLDLDNGELQPVKNVQGNAALPQYAALRLSLSSDTLVAFASTGITSALDVGISVPIIRYEFRGALGIFLNQIDITQGDIVIPPQSSTGVGDVAVRAKYRFLPVDDGGFAALVEVTVPTGDPDNFRGLDLTRTLVSAVWSAGGRLAPHVNVGYEFWSDSVRLTSGSNAAVKDQIKYAFGIEWEANPRATLVIDVLGRHLKGGGRARYETLQNVFGPGTSLQALAAIPEGITAVSVAPGVKLNMWKNVLATGNILLSVRNDGLRARATPVLGLDWSF